MYQIHVKKNKFSYKWNFLFRETVFQPRGKTFVLQVTTLWTVYIFYDKDAFENGGKRFLCIIISHMNNNNTYNTMHCSAATNYN
jgi:hypothetical protein